MDSFSEREAEEQAERERLKRQWLREQEMIKSKFTSKSYLNELNYILPN